MFSESPAEFGLVFDDDALLPELQAEIDRMQLLYNNPGAKAGLAAGDGFLAGFEALRGAAGGKCPPRRRESVGSTTEFLGFGSPSKRPFLIGDVTGNGIGVTAAAAGLGGWEGPQLSRETRTALPATPAAPPSAPAAPSAPAEPQTRRSARAGRARATARIAAQAAELDAALAAEESDGAAVAVATGGRARRSSRLGPIRRRRAPGTAASARARARAPVARTSRRPGNPADHGGLTDAEIIECEWHQLVERIATMDAPTQARVKKRRRQLKNRIHAKKATAKREQKVDGLEGVNLALKAEANKLAAINVQLRAVGAELEEARDAAQATVSEHTSAIGGMRQQLARLQAELAAAAAQQR